MRYSPSNKLLIMLPFWAGDRNLAFKLARLIADLEDSHSTQADFLFVARFDCKQGDQTIRYLSRKFNVHAYVSPKRGTGWPNGCSSIFMGGMAWCYHKMKAGQVPGYKAVFNMAADTAPLAKNWIGRLSAAWDAARPAVVAGALVPGSVHSREHINGDAAMLSGDLKFLHWLVHDVEDIKVPAGWDWVLASDFQKRGWADFPFVRSLWRHPPGFTQVEWDYEVARGTAIIHGVKDDSLLELSRKNLLV